MHEIEYKKTYAEYKRELDTELSKTAESFVRIGYLLKVARDTDILVESGYKNMAEFAHAEYGLSDTYVSRFIKINDKFSEGGYSDHLLPEYQGFGYAKLALMLQLPDSINAELSPAYTKTEIQAIKDEVDEEKKVSDIERMLEAPSSDRPLIEQIIYWLGKAEPELYMQISERMADIWTVEDIKECMAPQGEKTYSVRVPGAGRMLLMLNEETACIVSTRTGEKTETGWGEIGQQWEKIRGSKEQWQQMYGDTFPENNEVAPVQPKKETKVVKAEKPKEPEEPKEPPKQQTIHSVEPSVPEPDPIPEEPEKAETQEEAPEEPEPQLPGQMEVVNTDMETEEYDNQQSLKAAITEKLKSLQIMWENGEPAGKMLEAVKELKHDLQRLKGEEGC